MSAGPSGSAVRTEWSGPFTILLAASVLLIMASETLLLQRKYDIITGGFLAIQVLDTFARRFTFFLSSAVFDLILVLAIWMSLAPVLRRIRLSPLRAFGLMGFAGVAVPLSIDYLELQIHNYVGDLISLRYLYASSASNPAEMMAQSIGHLDPLAFVLGGSLVCVAAILFAAGRLERSVPIVANHCHPPSLKPMFRLFLLASATAIPALVVLTLNDSPVAYALGKKPSGDAAYTILQWVTDFDRDGHGLLSQPRDTGLFDASLGPYAEDIPGNGVDENSVGGDHPASFRPALPRPSESPRFSKKPHVLLVFLESVRADLIRRKLREQEITPFLNRLAREGASSEAAYSHEGYTVPSRAQLFGGWLDFHPGQVTLIDDFKANGYRIGYFSGQDDSFGDSGPLVGYDRADLFYDARQDVNRRYSQFTTPASLAVSWKIVNEKAIPFIEDHDPATPLLLYVNYHDTHFPYHHRELDNILGIEPLSRSGIRPGAKEALWETYANSAANVDRAIEQLVGAWRKRFDGYEQAILVTSDHGEALFDQGLLGHGISLDPEQLRVPLIIWGIGGEWPEPIGLSDIRYQLQRSLSGHEIIRQPAFVPDPARRILQYVGPLHSPRLLAWRGLSDCFVYDFFTRRFGRLNGRRALEEVVPASDNPLFQSLIWTWEALVQTHPR